MNSLAADTGHRKSVAAPNRQTHKDDITGRRLTAVRINQLLRWSNDRRDKGVDVPVRVFVRVACDALALQKSELDYYRLADFTRRARVEIDDETSAIAAIHTGCARIERDPHYRGLPAEWAGRALGVTADERGRLNLTTLGSIDESRTAREQRKAAEKLVRDRARAKAKRAAAGCVSRAEYRAKALSRSRPWEAEGLSRAT